MQFQLEQTQWWPPAELERCQMQQLQLVLRHAHAALPFWRGRLDAAGFKADTIPGREWFSTLPLLTRADIQTLGDVLLSRQIPSRHGALTQGETSGSTGRPITYYGTELTQFFWRAFTLRDHLWQQRDFSGKLAAIRLKVEQEETKGWGPATDVVFKTGPCSLLNLRTDIDAQLDWLQREAPQYLITNAQNLLWLARRSSERGIRLTGLKQARCFGGVVADDTRAAVREAWGVGLADMYTAEEVGYIALQCPQTEHYHVQAESVIVEILDDANMVCAPGQIGRVVITALHNFAMPLIRYALGDYAEAGGACACGRGLPVIRRIMGRERNILVLPDGRRHWPSFPSGKWAAAAPVHQLQMIQKKRDEILLRVVAVRELSIEERQRLIAVLQDCLGYPFKMELEYLSEIPRAANYKFEDFVSEIEG